MEKKNKNKVLEIINDDDSITNQLKTVFATGTWGAHKHSYFRTGVSQVLSRISYLSHLSHLRRIIIPIGREGKNVTIRMIHTSEYGFICPTETPEGQQAGIVLNFALLTKVSQHFNPLHIQEIIHSFNIDKIII